MHIHAHIKYSLLSTIIQIWQPGQQAAFMLPVSGHAAQGSFIALSQPPHQVVSPVITAAMSGNEVSDMIIVISLQCIVVGLPY